MTALLHIMRTETLLIVLGPKGQARAVAHAVADFARCAGAVVEVQEESRVWIIEVKRAGVRSLRAQLAAALEAEGCEVERDSA